MRFRQTRDRTAHGSLEFDDWDAEYFRSWHEADIKLRPLFVRYGVENGLHWLVMSISAFDP